MKVSERMHDNFGQLQVAICDIQIQQTVLSLNHHSSNSSNDDADEKDGFVMLPDRQDNLTKDMVDKRKLRDLTLEADRKIVELLRERTDKLFSLLAQINE